MSSSTTIVICTINRPEILDEPVRALVFRSRFDGAIVVSAGSETSVLPQTAELEQIEVFHGVKGLTRQRNAALARVRTEYALFLDDDVELDGRYVDSMERLFEAQADIVIACGLAVLDRLETRSIVTREMALSALAGKPTAFGWEDSPRWIRGHNMFVRTEVARDLGFDERLPLYGLYEDLDFVARCQRFGRAARNLEARLAHLGVMSGRINEVRLGYSQFANSCYLMRKGIWAARVVFRVCAAQFAKNLVGAMLTRNADLADRRSRLKGNLFAIADLFRGRLDPDNILAL